MASGGVGWALQPGGHSSGRQGSSAAQAGAAHPAAWRSASRDAGIAAAGVFTTAQGPLLHTGPDVLHAAEQFSI